MKFNRYHLGLALLPMLAGCADYIDTDDYIVEKPASIAEFEYLNEYKPLKEYVNRSAHPGFTLGTALSVDDYLKQGSVYLLTNSNFDMMTAGNAMKYASCVADDGTMNFDKVRSFVDAAKNVGMQIYGHTLLWHSQQNNKWLNSLLADKEFDFDPDAKNEVVDFELDFSSLSEYTYWHQSPDATVFSIEDGCLKIDNPAAVNFWEVQYFTFDNVNLQKDVEYQLTVELKATAEGAVQGNVGGWSDNAGIRIPYSTDWETKTITFTSATDGGTHGLFQTGDLVGTIWYKSIKISHLEAPAMEIGVSLMSGGDADKGESANIIAREHGNSDISARVVDDPAGTGKVYECNYNANPSEAWDSQLFISSNEPLEAGTKVHVKFRYRATDARSIDTQAHGAPGSYHHWQFIGTLNATTDWQEHEYTGTISGDQAGSDGCSAIAFNLSSQPAGGTFYIDDVVFEKIVSANTIPLTPEEKAEVLDAELGRWIKGMMDATGGYVKAWDLMNEGLADTWGDIDLKHQSTVPDANAFYWQDYLGDMYVRNAVKYARQYYAEQENANPDDLKLFINDYNLEATYNNNDKAKSLVKWIAKWEEDGVTRIDGIGSQMHISYSCNPTEQKKREEGVVNMLKILAASGKLIRITELDMGIDDENGNAIQTADVTLEQHKAMGEYYRFIINKYFELVPVEQQFGICHWCQTDSPEGSGWRANTPVGLWNLNLQRKPTYGGYADGLGDN